jgi:hypothetical protein
MNAEGSTNWCPNGLPVDEHLRSLPELGAELPEAIMVIDPGEANASGVYATYKYPEMWLGRNSVGSTGI